jgi:o-succinylbenzoate synthase
VLVPLDDLLATARVVSLPLATPFRGITHREAVLFRGPLGWSEFSPFLEYDDEESSAWLAAAIEFAYEQPPAAVRSRIPVNATLPAVRPDQVGDILARFGECRTVKIKVAARGQTLADDIARVAEVRQVLGPTGRIRVDANGAWNLDEAEHAAHALAPFDLEYMEQPCESVDELVQLRERIAWMGIPVAADESVRKADDPLAVARAGAADLLILKVQPLGGITACLRILEQTGLPGVLSSALETSVGLAMSLYCAAAVPALDYDCGLATAALFAADVAEEPLIAVDGMLDVRRVTPTADTCAADPDRRQWWLDRLGRCHTILSEC